VHWQDELFPDRGGLQRSFVLIDPTRAKTSFQPEQDAVDALHVLLDQMAKDWPEVSFHVTGPVPMNSEELVTVADDAGLTTVLSFAAVALVLIWGLRSPVPVASRMLYAVGTLAAGATLAMPADHPERALYVIEGTVALDGTPVAAGTLATVESGAPAVIVAAADARIAVFGGAPLDGPRFVWWNFVASERERIEAAKARWREDRFEPIEGETERIPLPD
jgi:hypothetical protein